MEERKIYRGNFVNFMTGEVDHTLARSSEYTLKIVEGEKESFYHVQDGNYLADFFSEVDKVCPKRMITCVLTDWAFLKNNVHSRYLRNMYNDFMQEKCDAPIDLTNLHDWAKQFHFLSIDIILRLYWELGYCFKKIEHKKKYRMKLDDEFSCNVTHQIDEFQIDSEWYLYLCRKPYSGSFSKSFRYNLKKSYVVKKEEKEFQKACHALSEDFSLSYNLVKALLSSCHGNATLCRNVLEDAVSVRKCFLSSQPDSLDTIYKESLKTHKELAFSHFISNWDEISNYFIFYSKSLKNELINFMLGH